LLPLLVPLQHFFFLVIRLRQFTIEFEFIFCPVSLTDDGELTPIVSEYEEKGFRGPSSIAVDAVQTVYFTDSGPLGTSSLQSPVGSVFAISGSTQVLQPLAFECLAHPCGVALAPGPPHDPMLAPVYVAEMARNRILRFVQSPKGVYHCSVFHQFSGGVGPSGLACDASGHVFVARFELHGLGCNGYVSILDAEGKLLREIATPAPEISGITVGGYVSFYDCHFILTWLLNFHASYLQGSTLFHLHH
jgi:sugar lactone lactonase YvrE